jgi:magnesium chelatase subunit I
VAASGENVVEREGLSVRHPARFVLVGSGNPEEGELRPQLLDRFGLSVEVRTPEDLTTRVEVVRRRDAYERDGAAFAARWQGARTTPASASCRRASRLGRRGRARRRARTCRALCIALGTDGLRGELTLVRAARALAALEGAKAVADDHLRRLASPSLRHRLRRNPLDDSDASTRVARVVAEQFG